MLAPRSNCPLNKFGLLEEEIHCMRNEKAHYLNRCKLWPDGKYSLADY